MIIKYEYTFNFFTFGIVPLPLQSEQGCCTILPVPEHVPQDRRWRKTPFPDDVWK